MKVDQKKQSNTMIWFDSSIIGTPSEEMFHVQYWEDKNQVVGSAKGRGTTWFIQLDAMQAALRHYFRGGLFRKLVKDRYLFTGWCSTRSAREFQLLLKLNKSGVNVPRPIAAIARRSLVTYQADLISERVTEAQDLVGVLRQAKLSKNMYKKIGQEISKIHKAGVIHTDLNIHNILIDSSNNVWIIDFDKCYESNNEKVYPSNLDRLLRSFRKEQSKGLIHWEEKDFESLVFGYEQ